MTNEQDPKSGEHVNDSATGDADVVGDITALDPQTEALITSTLASLPPLEMPQDVHERLLAARYGAEIRPDGPVENVPGNDFKRRSRGMNGDRYRTHVADRIDQQGQRRNVVEVGVGQENVVDGCQFGKRQVSDTRPRVNQDVIIDEHGCGSQMAPANAAATAQNPDFHAGSTGFRCCPLLPIVARAQDE